MAAVRRLTVPDPSPTMRRPAVVGIYSIPADQTVVRVIRQRLMWVMFQLLPTHPKAVEKTQRMCIEFIVPRMSTR